MTVVLAITSSHAWEDDYAFGFAVASQWMHCGVEV